MIPSRSVRRLIGILSAIVFAVSPAFAQESAESRPAPLFETTSGTFFGLSVADRAASARWYSEKLGLEVVMEVPGEGSVPGGNGPGMTLLQGGGLTVELVDEKEAKPLGTVAPGVRGALFVHGIFKVGFVVEDFEATLEGVRSRGVEIALGPFAARPDQRENFLIRDNAGNYIQIFGEYSTE